MLKKVGHIYQRKELNMYYQKQHFTPRPPPRLLFLNILETVKAVTLAFCCIQWHFIRDIRARFGIPNSRRSKNIGQNVDGGISNFRISDQPFIKKNCHNSRTSYHIDMKYGPVTTLYKRNKITSKNFTMKSCRQTVASLSFFRLEHPDV